MNKSEIAEKEKFEQFLRDSAGKRFPRYRSINGFTFTGGDSGLLRKCWERAIAESQAPRHQELFGRAMTMLKGLNLALGLEWELAPSIKKEIADICAESELGPPPTFNELLESARHHVMTGEEKEAQRQSWVRGEMALSESESPPVEPCQCVCHKVGLFGLMCCPCTKKALDELVNGKPTEPAIPSGAAQEVSPVDSVHTITGPERPRCPRCGAETTCLSCGTKTAGDTRELKAALKKAARNLYEASELLRDKGSDLASAVYDSSMEALAEAEKLLG